MKATVKGCTVSVSWTNEWHSPRQEIFPRVLQRGHCGNSLTGQADIFKTVSLVNGCCVGLEQIMEPHFQLSLYPELTWTPGFSSYEGLPVL